ncbi:hypothetical protein FEM48_Zijuj05G0054600 [Ziziphus jujuba var. spinosa]|uniref:Uncharacterized protein n=1 Tax=Ziziphus jujuba var. spinosa TaxID=714518 RepID=A0A978VD30_ZIZJJ|nr:hypothetical protein FEM48_Zijuj05G0054600 [Ziziphus jujuba var. spinosa]
MATSAFKSTSKRTPIGAPSASVDDSASSNRNSAHRRSRSLSRFSRRLTEPAIDDFDDVPAPKGKFVNTVRGSGFPEISLDDLAVEFFGSSGDRGRSGSRNSQASPASGSSAAQRRGRSVSRQGSKLHGSGGNGGGDGRGNVVSHSGGGGVGTENSGNSRRRRSVSVVRYQVSDSESDQNGSDANSKSFTSRNNQTHLSHKPTASSHRPGMRRSLSQKDFKSCDGYSSHSSVLTDDEGRDTHFSKNGIERTIRAVYAKKKGEHPTGDDANTGFYEVMRKELRNAVEKIRTELEHAMVKTKSTVPVNGDVFNSNSSDVLKAVTSIRQNYSTKLEQSEKRKQDLLSEIVLEEQRNRELSKIVKELLPEQNNSVRTEKPPQSRRRSTDRSRMSKRLTEEAEKYIEDFLSNVEDTDISSLDGERSDTSSSLGGITKTEISHSPAVIVPLPVEMDGVVLPWLQWETSNEVTPLPYKNKMDPPVTPKTISWDAAQEVSNSQDRSIHSASSRGSWSPGIIDSHSMNIREGIASKLGELGHYQCPSYTDGPKTPSFDMEEYLKLQSNEDVLFERIRQQQRISSGSLLLCNRMFF